MKQASSSPGGGDLRRMTFAQLTARAALEFIATKYGTKQTSHRLALRRARRKRRAGRPGVHRKPSEPRLRTWLTSAAFARRRAPSNRADAYAADAYAARTNAAFLLSDSASPVFLPPPSQFFPVVFPRPLAIDSSASAADAAVEAGSWRRPLWSPGGAQGVAECFSEMAGPFISHLCSLTGWPCRVGYACLALPAAAAAAAATRAPPADVLKQALCALPQPLHCSAATS